MRVRSLLLFFHEGHVSMLAVLPPPEGDHFLLFCYATCGSSRPPRLERTYQERKVKAGRNRWPYFPLRATFSSGYSCFHPNHARRELTTENSLQSRALISCHTGS